MHFSIEEVGDALTRAELQLFFDQAFNKNGADPKKYLIAEGYALFGVIKFYCAYYLLLVTHVKEKGEIFGSPIYEVRDTELIQVQTEVPSPVLTRAGDPLHRRREEARIAARVRGKVPFCVLQLQEDEAFLLLVSVALQALTRALLCLATATT